MPIYVVEVEEKYAEPSEAEVGFRLAEVLDRVLLVQIQRYEIKRIAK